MRVTVNDQDVLGALRPLDIAAYLRARGWTQVGPGSDDPMTAWEKSVDGELFEVYSPRHQDWRDYPRRVREILDTLAQVEKRSELAIIRDIGEVTADVVRLIAHNGGRSDGSIPFLDGLHLGSAGRGMMLSAACAAVEPKRVYHSRKPTKATEYLDSLRLGQSERGSYVLTVISRVAPALIPRQALLPIPGVAPAVPEEPFERRVTQVLAHSLVHLSNAASKGAASGDFDAFESAVPAGVSADLCDALALIRQCISVTQFEVVIGWAPTRPIKESTPARASFTRDALEVIEEAGRILRERGPVDGVEVEGWVVRLGRPDTQLYGEALVGCSIDGQSRKVSVELWGDDWKLADEALGQRHRLRCVGELHRTGKKFVLKRVRDVSIVQDE